MKAYVYIVRCADGSLYTGYTTDPERRLSEHNTKGRGAKYTRSRQPVSLVYTECFENEDGREAKRLAQAREWEIKHRFTKDEKEMLIKSLQSSHNGGKLQ